jgi:hypothetical protein
VCWIINFEDSMLKNKMFLNISKDSLLSFTKFCCLKRVCFFFWKFSTFIQIIQLVSELPKYYGTLTYFLFLFLNSLVPLMYHSTLATLTHDSLILTISFPHWEYFWRFNFFPSQHFIPLEKKFLNVLKII